MTGTEATTKKALVAMSGGVDSSVAAYLMKENGFLPVGVTMMLHEEDAASIVGTHSCCTPDDIEDARVVASTLGISFHVVNFLEGFRECIITDFIETYMRGETPNPCIECNRYMKFGRLFEMAEKEGCEKVVTGHYARIEYDEKSEIYRLKRAVDKTKDQTYVLYFLDQQQLSKLAFPDGEYEKTEIREIAEREGLFVASKHDSQDICFVPDGDYAGFIERNRDDLPGEGDFLDMDGNVIGKSKGYFHYTIGQRKGLGISSTAPLYVTKIIPEKNQVILGSNDDLFTREVHAINFNLISMPENVTYQGDDILMHVTAKVRYRAKDTSGVLTLHGDKTATMLFDEPVRAVTPGQSLVVYDGEYCVGGGIINEG
ncbi:MAG: tRNA 2-thiouridine(34) synthase MnmA [Eubacterium sp.]|nr:tRNA 2-thiouridine(34) synthase MnmA [Eubacterium sp.]